MAYPTLQQYNEALQNPKSALLDPTLKYGQVKTTGLGLPLALCGGFALTYTITNGLNKYAVRCFQKESGDLEQRYRAISNKLNSINSPYFVGFAFQTQGVKVNGINYPIVRMDWAAGKTLGEYLEANCQNKPALSALANSLFSLSAYLESQKIAHGDIQPGNVMVSSSGQKIQLIDYDGMYVEGINHLGSSELGLRNFQHPLRNRNYWDHTLDRFSFIALTIALRALQVKPNLWTRSQSDSETILFSATDYEKPENSAIFAELRAIPEISEFANNFALICKSSIKQIPTLVDFLAKRNIPRTIITFTTTATFGETQYISSLPILDAAKYSRCLEFTGQRIELIGKITEVKLGRTRYKNLPYYFINFGDWRGRIVKLAIWSDGIERLQDTPNTTWTNKWVSVIGLLDPPYSNEKYGYTHQSITITQSNQIRFISDSEARRRLAGRQAQAPIQTRPPDNTVVLERARNAAQLQNTQVQTVGTSTSSGTPNQQILDRMSSLRSSQTSSAQSLSSSSTPPNSLSSANRSLPPSQSSGGSLNNTQHTKSIERSTSSPSQNSSPPYVKPSYPEPKKKSTSSDFCFIATSLFGQDGPETKILRQFRDQHLLPNWFGRRFVRIYYKLSPIWVQIISRNRFAQQQTLRLVNSLVDMIVRRETKRLLKD